MFERYHLWVIVSNQLFNEVIPEPKILTLKKLSLLTYYIVLMKYADFLQKVSKILHIDIENKNKKHLKKKT